jgi:hypothetical protein
MYRLVQWVLEKPGRLDAGHVKLSLTVDLSSSSSLSQSTLTQQILDACVKPVTCRRLPWLSIHLTRYATQAHMALGIVFIYV